MRMGNNLALFSTCKCSWYMQWYIVFYYNQNISKTILPGEKLGTFLESSLNSLQEKWGSVGGQKPVL
ncbi:hypothetical protein BpHYR1_041805 [Brachionus plicatilis]|uniref:Uncharacterized protein n=1 Tax=Brachionus plicatilis TaxID=10195 RepID=A0A3M7QM10_BRAPC|nr:hypothetical protein BpHYR1_041805 [Brachionus plicatilis]